jgi:hypothetical protein
MALPETDRGVVEERSRQHRLEPRGLTLAFALSAGSIGCGASHGWMPAVVLGASLTRAGASQTNAAGGATTSGGGSWSFGADVSVEWLPTPSESGRAAHRLRLPATPATAPCASAAICAWEREARAQTSSGTVTEETEP